MRKSGSGFSEDVFITEVPKKLKFVSGGDVNLLYILRFCKCGVILVGLHYLFLSLKIFIGHLLPLGFTSAILKVITEIVSLNEFKGLSGVWLSVLFVMIYIKYDIRWEREYPVETSRFNKMKKYTFRYMMGVFVYGISTLLLTFSYMKLFDNIISFRFINLEGRDLFLCEIFFILTSSTIVGCLYHEDMKESSENVVKVTSKYYESFASILKKIIVHGSDVFAKLCKAYFMIYVFGFKLFESMINEVVNKEPIDENEDEEPVQVKVISWNTLTIGFFTIWLVLSFFKLSIFLVHKILTERIIFPVDNNLYVGSTSTSTITISQAMSSENKFLKYMAFFDFSTLTQNDHGRINLLFKLSYPGGNPNNWKSVSSKCIKQIDDFSLRIRKYVQLINETPRDEVKEESKKSNFDIFSPKYNNKDRVNLFSTPSPSSLTSSKRANMRNLGSPDPSTLTLRVELPSIWSTLWPFSFDPFKYFNPFVNYGHKVSDFIKNDVKEKMKFLQVPKRVSRKCVPIISKDVFNLFVETDLVSFAVHGLTDICCISLHIDKRGVVQTDLITIMNSMLCLTEELNNFEREIKNSKYSSKPEPVFNDCLAIEKKLKDSCLIDLRRIYSLYGQHFREMEVSSDFIQRFQSQVGA